MSKTTHTNYHTGEPCDCFFGRSARQPSWEFTAAKLDMLRKREDLQTPEAQKILDMLANKYPSIDKLYPLIVNGWKAAKPDPEVPVWAATPQDEFDAFSQWRQAEYLTESPSEMVVFDAQGNRWVKDGADLQRRGVGWSSTTAGSDIATLPSFDLIRAHGPITIGPQQPPPEDPSRIIRGSKGERGTAERYVSIGPNGIRGNSVTSPYAKGIPEGQLSSMLSDTKELKKHGRGVNFDSFSLPDLFVHMEKESEWLQERERPKLGQTVHKFDNGWSIRRLQNEHECIREGKDMHHCTGNPGQPTSEHSHYKGVSYREGVDPDPDKSTYHLYSLRDKDNFPHATLELNDRYDGSDNEVVQLQGPNDTPGTDEELEMVNEFLGPHGLSTDWGTGEPDACRHCANDFGGDGDFRDGLCEDCWDEHNREECRSCANEAWRDGLCEDCWEHENYEPWWEDEYETEPANDADSYFDQFVHEDLEGSAPEEWERASNDADTYEKDPPELVQSDPLHDEVWDDIANPMRQPSFDPLGGREQQHPSPGLKNLPFDDTHHRKFDPENHQAFLDAAKQHGHLEHFHNAYQDWLTSEYEGAPNYPYEDHIHDFYNKAFAPHINPGTGAFEQPQQIHRVVREDGAYKREWETAADRYWKQQTENYPQLPSSGGPSVVDGNEPWGQFNDVYPNFDNIYPSFTNGEREPLPPTQVPPKPSYWSKVAKRKTHHHWEHGHPCGCPWGKHEGHTAARIDHLTGRPDLQTPEAQKFLDSLVQREYPDKLLNWMVREWKENRLSVIHRDDGGPVQGFLSVDKANEWVDILDQSKHLGDGIDLMQFNYEELQEKMEEKAQEQMKRDWPNLGEIVHTFQEEYDPSGKQKTVAWTMRKLRNSREAKIEGHKDQMNHCVGGYGKKIDNGNYHIYSLRDPDNRPHVTVQLDNDYPEAHAVEQIYAPNDTPVDNPDHLDKINEWLAPRDIRHTPFEPWWPPVYEVEIDNPAAYIVHNDMDGYGGAYDRDYLEPDEYQIAMYEADEHEVEPPELRVTGVDWPSIWSELSVERDYPRPIEQMRGLHRDFVATAAQANDLPEVRKQFDRWKNNKFPAPAWGTTPGYQSNNEHHQWMANFWPQAINEHMNADTGEFEPPKWDASAGAYTNWWERNRQRFPQIPGLESEPQPMPYAAKTAAPVYYRWTFAPDTGEVEIGHNEEDHPALIRYHEQLADQLNRGHVVHGYAYRIVDGWRLSDDEHKPLEDPYVVSQVLRALNMQSTPNRPSQPTEGPTWAPADQDFDRLHYGLPT